MTHLDTRLTLADAHHLLTRTGLGASPGELLRYTGKSRRWATESIVNGLRSEPGNAIPGWVHAPAPHYWARGRMPVQARRQFNRERDAELVELRQWWVREMIETTSPQTEKLTLFWHNHFTSSFADINHQSTSIARQHLLLRRLSAGNFRELLGTVLHDPAMLDYLDNVNNHKRAPNENLARELLELFTLGEGHYSEQDVRGAARALTGHSVAPMRNMSPRFKPWRHDSGTKTIFGQQGNFAVGDLVDLILARPQVAKFITTKFYRAFVNEHRADPQTIHHLAAHFRQTGYDIKSLYLKLLQSEAFWAPDNRNAIVKSPVDLVIGTIRTTGKVSSNWQTLPSTLANMGQNLFQPPNVAGWPGKDNWITPDRLLTRFSWLEQFASDDCSDADRPCTTADEPMMTGENMSAPHLTIQLAAENYQGAPGYQVSLLKDQQNVWQSAEQIVSGGHDTRTLGRLEPGIDMPWQQVHLPLGSSIPDFDQIRVSFLNDNGGKDGDRNLYINWVSVDNKRFASSNGVQISGCPPKQPEQAGSLYCSGDLLLSKPLPADFSQPPQSPDRLTAEAIYLNWLTDPVGKKDPRLVFTLVGVSFNEQQWHNLSVRFQIQRDGSYAMSMENHECWPDCFQTWPACARSADNQPELRALDFPLNTNGPANCHYQLLDEKDRLLVDTLWMHLPFFYHQVAENESHLKKHLATTLRKWRPYIDDLQQQLGSSIYSHSTTRQAVISASHTSHRRPALTDSTPLPAGNTADKYTDHIEQLQQQIPALSLQQLLLPDNADPLPGEPKLSTLLQQLGYQLY